MRTQRLALCALALAVAAVAASPALAAGKSKSRSNQGVGSLNGIGAGALFPQSSFSDFNDTSYFAEVRSLYAEKVFGGRASAYYGDTAGKNGADGGRVTGFDFAALVKFGSRETFGYVFAGAGYGKLTYTSAGPLPGTTVRLGGWDWCWRGGVGLTIKRGFYLEASYVSYQTDPTTTDFIPVVVGFQF